MKNRSNLLAGGIGQQIPRNSLALLITAQIVAVVPYAWQLAPWVIGIGFCSAYWRAMIYQGRWNYPQTWVKVVLVVASMTGIATTEFAGFSLEGAASLLVVAFALKFLEMKTRRDAYIVIYLGYFTIATEFLFNQSIPLTLYQIGAVVVVTAAMVGLNQLHTDARPGRALKVAAMLVAQAFPVMIVLFLFFPRLGTLWGVPMPGTSVTGITTHIRPGQIANLIQSDDVAMRVVFEDDIPPMSNLYWRGLVYSDYDKGTWHVSRNDSYHALSPDVGGRSYRYEVLQEPTSAKWLFGLRTAFPDQNDVETTRDFKIVARDSLYSTFRYGVRSYVDQRLDATDVLDSVLYERETRIPSNANPRIQSFARQLYAQSRDDETFVQSVLTHIRSEPYTYTLQPQAIPEPFAIDRFWFDTREGFCAHFASAFVFMVRSVGIPARLVGGYHGGEINPIGDHLVVRQYDAHAWAEVWIAGKGWLRVDPTAAVAPERIEYGFTSALSPEEFQALSPFGIARLGEINVLADIMHLFDSLEHRWTLWVLRYDQTAQQRLMRELFDSATPHGIAILLISLSAPTLVVIGFMWLVRRRRVKDQPTLRRFLKFAQRIERYGFERGHSESPGAFVARICSERGLDTSWYAPIEECLEEHLYARMTLPSTKEVRALNRALLKLQFRLGVSRA